MYSAKANNDSLKAEHALIRTMEPGMDGSDGGEDVAGVCIVMWRNLGRREV